MSHPAAGSELLRRIEALEEQMARRERVFQRLMDIFGAGGMRVP
jgi:hypothetical protein